MNADELIRRMNRLPVPRLSPFFATRTTARATTGTRPARTPAVMVVYWLVLAFVAGPVLMRSWLGVAAVIIGALAVALFPAFGVADAREPKELV